MKSGYRILGAALVATAVVVPSAAHAATGTEVQLEYQADLEAGCVGEDELRRMVTDQLGHDPFRPDAEQRVTITIVRTEAGFQGRIVWTEPDGRRVGERLVSSRNRDCGEIVANVAFAVALQLQLVERGAANAAGGAASGGEPPASAAPTNPTPAIVEPAAPAAEPAAASGSEGSTPLSLAIGAGPAVGLGMAPKTAAFGRLFISARLGRWSAEVAADGALPVTQREWDGSGVAVNAIGASAAGCAHVSVASACLLGRLGWVRGHGMGVSEPRTSWGRFGEVGARIAAAQELGRVIVSVHADALVMLSRWEVALDGAVVWSVPRVGGMVGADVALRFF